jgi:hypothetical protein
LSRIIPAERALPAERPIKNAMKWKSQDWIEHASFGLGRVNENRGDRLDIEFINSGAKTILRAADLKPANPPSLDYRFPSDRRKSGSSQFKVEPAPRRPALDFDYLVTCFISRFPDGFEGQDFHVAERGYKEDAANILKQKLGKDAFETLLRDRHHALVSGIAKHSLRSTNLVFRIEKAKFADAVENPANHERFANALYELLYGSGEMEHRFGAFSGLLSEMGVRKWPVATYFQFLATDGKWMFMKPTTMKRMAESLKISLSYKSEPNWLTYSKLQELADRVELELQNRKLMPHSRIDVQGFIWASIEIEEGKYGEERVAG